MNSTDVSQTGSNPYSAPETEETMAWDQISAGAQGLVDEVMSGMRYRTVPYVFSK